VKNEHARVGVHTVYSMTLFFKNVLFLTV